MPVATETPAPITKKQLDEYTELDAERLRLNRQARILLSRINSIEAKLVEYVRMHGEKKGKKLTTLTKFDFLLSLKMKPCNPSWRDEFIRVAGVDQAEEVARKAAKTLKESFELEKVT